MFLQSVIITINANKFNNNFADEQGGVLWSYYSNVTIEASEFNDNNIIATIYGGASQ